MMATRDDRVVVCVRLMPGEDGRHFLIYASEGFPHPHRILPAGYMNPGLLTRSIELARFSACVLKPAPPPEIEKATAGVRYYRFNLLRR